MEQIMSLLNSLGPIVTAVNAALVASIGVFLLIPGDQPEKALQKLVDTLTKFSKK